MPKPPRPPTKPIPVRLDGHTRDRLSAAALRLGSSSSAVIRLAIQQQLPGIESGRIALRPES